MTGWLDYWFNIWPFTAMKMYPIAKTLANTGSNFYQILNEMQKNAKDLQFFRQIWPHWPQRTCLSEKVFVIL